MLPRPPLPPGPFLVVGLARSGVAAALALRSRGEAVVGADAGVVAEAARARLEAAGVAVHAGTQAVELLDEARALVKSPGVPAWAPVVMAARGAAIPVLGELELGWRLVPNEVLAVTGSNGKTTTVELIGHVFRAGGRAVVVAGNVGTALSGLADSLDPAATLVLEVSSFQLEDTLAFAPEAGVLLNLAEDHLDRHGTFAAYRAAKLELFARQVPGTTAVVPAALALGDLPGAATRVTFGDDAAPGIAGAEPDLAHRDGVLLWRGAPLMRTDEIRLRGAHNRENAMAAAAATLAWGLPLEAVREGLATFGGVPHRLEEVARVGGVLYVNDSKATNVASALVALDAFPAGVHAILGGSRKGSDYGPLAAPLARRARAAYLIGETAPDVRAAVAPAGVPVRECGDLASAVTAARAAARPGDVVLLSPASASYDQYRDYEERGEHFRRLVSELGAGGG